MLELGVKTLIAYLLGTLLGSLLLGWFRGVDIRRLGSGNAGATNAMRTQGKTFGSAVLVFDIAKGVAAVVWVPALLLPHIGPAADLSREWLALACGLAAVLGHIYPVWFGFRGGKGVATMVGVIGALEPRLLLPLVTCWFAVILLTGYVGLASMLAAAALALTVWVLPVHDRPLLDFCIAITALVTFTHRANIARMAAGTEPRARLWLFRPRSA
ncbi:MAG: glycerol-3-phosphate 1-O-acyltransferase PlsY [Steroidobacteraceae bacterium]